MQRVPITSAQVRVLLDVEWLVRIEGRATVRRVATMRGCAISTAYTHLLALRKHGLVTWEGKGSLVPTVRAVAQGVR